MANIPEQPRKRGVHTEPSTAEYLGISLTKLRRMRRAGEIAYVRLSENRVGYTDEQREAIIDARTVKPTAA